MSAADERTDVDAVRLDAPDPWHVIDTVLLGRYRVRSVVGRGAQAVVYSAQHTLMPLKVAIKFLAVDAFKDPETALQRFRREAMILARLDNHASTLRVHDVDVFSDGRTPLMITELLEGEVLFERLKRNQPTEWREAFEMGVQVADALIAAHERGIVHRDVKPDNLFQCHDGRVKLLDFGIAKIIGTPAADDLLVPQCLTAMNTAIGTPSYMSPEQVRGDADLDGRSDVYSLGGVLYNLVTAQRLWPIKEHRKIMLLVATSDPVDVRKHAPELPEHVARVIRRALTRDRVQRPSMAELKDDLLAAIAEGGGRVTVAGREANAPQSVIDEGAGPLQPSVSTDQTTAPRSPIAPVLPSRSKAETVLLAPLAPTPTIFSRMRAALAAFAGSRRRSR